jgi:1-acyl-sn-glycerol-3-phosphate acyltransferase
VLFAEARRVLALQIITDGPSPDAHPGKPLIVACRHAGPGDSFTLIHALMDWYDREPRVVLKNTMAWDPMIDVVLHRIPARFISTQPRRGHDLDSQIAALATGLDENDAFVIFPEGGNFTPERRRRGIERLRRLGLERMAQRAEQMTHVLAPKPGGLLAAMDAAPEADVVLVAHTGLDHLVTVRDLWRELPMDKILVMRWWQVARDEIPADRDARIDWLFGWWEQIDTWVEANRPQDLPRVPRRREAATP